MARLHQAPHHVCAHASESDHPNLHGSASFFSLPKPQPA
jgi:hypothetical protein